MYWGEDGEVKWIEGNEEWYMSSEKKNWIKKQRYRRFEKRYRGKFAVINISLVEQHFVCSSPPDYKRSTTPERHRSIASSLPRRMRHMKTQTPPCEPTLLLVVERCSGAKKRFVGSEVV
jgi:hypothetical protein